MSAPSWASNALGEMCVRHGYCLSPDDQRRLIDDPPQDPQAFVDAVLVAEGLDPDVAETRVRRELAEVVRKWRVREGLV